MNKKPELTLNEIKKSPKLGRTFRASDFLTKEEQQELRQANLRGRRGKRKFDAVDAYAAEIIARFGYDTYKAWNEGELDAEKMYRMVLAERAREKALILPLESIIVTMVRDCIRRGKKDKKPKGPKEAARIIKQELKVIRGEYGN